MNKKDKRLRRLFWKLKRQKREEREAILQEHRKKWSEIDKRMYSICEKHTGHKFEPLPDNGWNIHDSNGEWPEACSICGIDKASFEMIKANQLRVDL